MQGNPTESIKLTLTDLQSTDPATPNLWDNRYKVLLDNDAILNARMEKVEKGERATKNVQTVGSLTALRAFTGMLDGEVVYIPFTGLYRYYAGLGENENLPWVLRPDSNAGRWRLDMVPRALLGQAGGAASLDSNGFLEQSVRNQSITAEKLAPGAVSSAQLGDITVNDATVLNSNTASVGTVVSALANRLRAITGQNTWSSAPGVTLATLNTFGARTDRAQTWGQKQTMNSVQVTSELIIPVV